MRYGLLAANAGSYADPHNLVRVAETAEAAGWEALLVWDHLSFVWGPPGAVYGYADTGPAIDDGPIPEGGDPDADVGEVYELYVDPTAQGLGGGSALLDAAIEGFVSAGFERAELSVLSTNERAQAFYRSHGWEHTGRTMAVDLGVVAFEEHRFARPLRPAHS